MVLSCDHVETAMVSCTLSRLCDVLQETLKVQLEGKSHVSDAIAKEVSSALVMAALKKGTLDNVTVVVLLLRWD